MSLIAILVVGSALGIVWRLIGLAVRVLLLIALIVLIVLIAGSGSHLARHHHPPPTTLGARRPVTTAPGTADGSPLCADSYGRRVLLPREWRFRCAL